MITENVERFIEAVPYFNDLEEFKATHENVKVSKAAGYALRAFAPEDELKQVRKQYIRELLYTESLNIDKYDLVIVGTGEDYDGFKLEKIYIFEKQEEQKMNNFKIQVYTYENGDVLFTHNQFLKSPPLETVNEMYHQAIVNYQLGNVIEGQLNDYTYRNLRLISYNDENGKFIGDKHINVKEFSNTTEAVLLIDNSNDDYKELIQAATVLSEFSNAWENVK